MPPAIIRGLLNKKVEATPILILISALLIYFVVMPATHVPCIQTEQINKISYFNKNAWDGKWDSGWTNGVIKQIFNATHLDCGPRARQLHWLVEWVQAKVDVRRIYLLGFSLYNYCGVFTNLVNCFLVFLIIYRLFNRYSVAAIGASFFLMNAQSLSVPFYWYTNKFKTITIFLFTAYIIISKHNSHEYLAFRNKFLEEFRKSIKKIKRSPFRLENLLFGKFFLVKGMKLFYHSFYQNSLVFYGLCFVVALLNSFADEISLICLIPWLILVLFYRGLIPFIICFGIFTWAQLFNASFYYILAPKIFSHFYEGSFWNPEQDLYSSATSNTINEILFGLFRPDTYRLLIKQLGATLGYSDSMDFKSNSTVIFSAIAYMICLAGVLFDIVKNRLFKYRNIFFNFLIVTIACVTVWKMNSIIMGSRTFNFPYNYPLVMLSIPAGLIIGFLYERLIKKKLLLGIIMFVFLNIVFISNIRSVDKIIGKEFNRGNCYPFIKNVVEKIDRMGNFIKKNWDYRPFYISYPNLTLENIIVTPSRYQEEDMIFGFQAIIQTFYVRYFEKGDILPAIVPYELFYTKKIKQNPARVFYDIFRDKKTDLNNLLDKSKEIGEITYPSNYAEYLIEKGQLGLPEIRCHGHEPRNPLKEKTQFNIHINEINIDKNIKIGFYLQNIVLAAPLVKTPFRLILIEDGMRTKEVLIEHDYGYSFKFYDISLVKPYSKHINLIIKFEELEGNFIRDFYIAGPFLFTGNIWQDVI